MAKPRLLAIVLESSDITTGQAVRMIAASLVQCARDFCPRWDIAIPSIRLFQSESDVPAGWDLVVFLPSSDVANALGYHSETPAGRKFARIFTAGYSLADIQEVFSHEVLELLADYGVNRYAMAPNGWLYALEVCDWVQGQRYYIDLGDKMDPIAVADFICPAALDMNAQPGEELNFNKQTPLPGPFAIGPEGYAATLQDGKPVSIGLYKKQHHEAGRFDQRMAA